MVVLLAWVGCAAPTVGRTETAPLVPAGLDARQSAALADRLGMEISQTLAAVDARLAAREHVVPTSAELGHAALTAIVGGDESIAVVKGGVDLFSFEVRARQLDAAHARLTTVAQTTETAPSGSPVARPRLELELLARLVDQERARVEAERDLPRSASELVRGVVSTWAPVESLTEARERDAWLTKRVDEVGASLTGASLRPIEVLELEDALDPLERLADPAGFPGTQAAMARLRLVLGKLHGGARHADGWEGLRRSLVVHLGLAPPPEALRATLERLEARLREEGTLRLTHPAGSDADAARRKAEGALLRPGTCDAGHGSRVRSFLPPPERSAICAALEEIAHPKSDPDALAAVLALHDDVALALWAVDIDGDDRDPERAASAHPLLAAIPPEREARLVRLVAARPVAPIGVALMLDLLDRGGPDQRAARAALWLAFGDAPLDIVARELSF